MYFNNRFRNNHCNSKKKMEELYGRLGSGNNWVYPFNYSWRHICCNYPYLGRILGLLLAGMVVGYMVGGDAMNGAVNGALAGVFGALVLSLLLLIAGTLILGIIGFAAATITSVFILIGFVGVMLIMAVGGAIGSVVKNEPEVKVVEYYG